MKSTLISFLLSTLLITQVVSFQYNRVSSDALRESSELSAEQIENEEHVRHRQHHKIRHPHRRHHRKSQNDLQSVEKVVVKKSNKPLGLFELLVRENIIKIAQPQKVEEQEVGIFDNIQQNETEKKVHPNCPKCNKNAVEMSEEELSELRISYVKNQILQKLRLEKRPDPIDRPILPKPILDGVAIQSNDDMDDLNRRLDDFYAKTTQKVLFLSQEFERCKKHNKHNPSVCFSFKIPQDVDVSSIESAHLWIYKKHNHDMNFNHTFEISEVSHWGDDKDHVKRNPLAIQQTNFDEGWVKIDLNWSVRNWLQYEELTHVVQIACKTCGPKHVPIGLKNDRKPFIVIDTLPQKNLNRGRRSSVNCSPQTKTCCRESQYISFADIGWDDWIIFPPGYDAYFCRGTCSTAGSITRDGSYHSTIMREFYHNTKNDTKKLELVPCCTATRYSSLQLVVYQNNVPTKKTLPNLVVESCGCM